MNEDDLKLPPLTSEESPDFVDDPIIALNQTKETKAITLRLNKAWIRKLDKIAYRLSNYYRKPITKQFLIKEVIGAHIVQVPLPELFKKLMVRSERQELTRCKRILKLVNHGGNYGKV